MLNKVFDKESFYKIITLAWPLILVTCNNVIQQFIDKIFLAQYSQEALAAVLPAGMVVGLIIFFFTGTISYVSNFVAQYIGANKQKEIPKMVNQALLLSVIFSFICFLFSFCGEFVFVTLAKHTENLASLEIEYFKPSIYCATFPILMSCYSSFFTGIEKTKIILFGNIIVTISNICLDYIFIYGKFGFPELGISGAAWATQIGTLFGLIFIACLYYSHKYDKKYATKIRFKFDKNLLKKLCHYGLPSGVQMAMDFLVWTIFIMLIGRLSIVNLAASNIAFQIDQIAFMPVLGVGISVSILIANYLGQDKPDETGKIIKTSLTMAFIFDFIVVLYFILAPKLLISPFIDFNNPDPELIRISIGLLRILSIYVLFDGFGIIFVSVLKGAGDTLFIFWTMFINGVILIIIPGYISTVINNIYFGWAGVVLYIFVIFIIFLLRVKQGKWKKIKIIA